MSYQPKGNVETTLKCLLMRYRKGPVALRGLNVFFLMCFYLNSALLLFFVRGVGVCGCDALLWVQGKALVGNKAHRSFKDLVL